MPDNTQMPEDVALCLDSGGRIVAAHGPVERILSRRDVTGQRLTQLLPQHGMGRWARAIADAVQGRPHTFGLATEQGMEHVTVAPVDPGGAVTVVARLTHEAENLSADSLPSTGDVLYRIRLRPRLSTSFISSSVEEMTGVPPANFLQDPETFLLVTHPADRALLRSALDEPENVTEPITLRWSRPDGSLVWTSHRLGAIHEHGQIVGVDGIARDVTVDRTRELLLAEASLHDPVTLLPNEALCRDRMETALRSSVRTGAAVGAIACKIDRGGDIDDALFPDPHLQQRVAARLQSLLDKSEASLAKTDDTTFVVVAGTEEPAGLMRLGEEIRTRMRTAMDVGGREIQVTASVGVAVGDPAHETAQEVIHHAMSAAYLAAVRGGDRCELHAHTRRAHVVKRLEAEEALRQAVEKGSFSVVYQPVVDLRTGELSETEALARWKHPEQGLLPAGDFLQMAEETGMIVAMGRTVLVTSCRDAITWIRFKLDAPPIGVNLSTAQFEDPGLVEDVHAILTGVRMDPGRLGLEVGEETLLREPGRTEHITSSLKDIGVRIVVDDYTGATSPAWLDRWGVSAIKVDMEITSGLKEVEPPRRSLATVRAARAAADALGIDLIAKGIETRLQGERLLQEGYSKGQGYWFAPAVSSGVVPTLFGMDLRGDRKDS